MPSAAPVTLLPTQDWDPRILVCQYDLAMDDYTLPMHVFIVVSRRYVVLVDTLVNQEIAGSLLDIARPHLAGRRLLVVNTHADYDHAWGNQFFLASDSPAAAPVIGTRRCAQRLRSRHERDQLDRLRREQPHLYANVQLTPPTILFDDTLTIDGGDLTLSLFATPGHTPGHCSLHIPEIRTLLAGDAAELPFPSAGDGGLVDLRASLDRLAALHARTALYCHAPPSAGPALIDGNIAYFATLEARCRTALAHGTPARPAPDADLEQMIRFPFADAVPPGAESWAEPRFYRPAHHTAIRAMLDQLSLADWPDDREV